MASTKLLFVKMIKPSKLDFLIDFKGGKCYKIDTSKSATPNPSLISSNKSLPKQAKDRMKELTELIELIGINRYGFVIETLNGYRMLLISDYANIVGDWVSAINSIIQQFVI